MYIIVGNGFIRSGLVLAMLAICCFGQEKSSESTPKTELGNVTYKLDFVLSEVQEGKRVNARTYTMLVRETDWAKIRLGDRVPVSTGTGQQYQYIDVGTSLDARISKEVESGLPISVVADVSSIVPEPPGEKFPAPLVRQLRYQLDAVVPLGKQTTISSADELLGNRHLQIEVTATKIR